MEAAKERLLKMYGDSVEELEFNLKNLKFPYKRRGVSCWVINPLNFSRRLAQEIEVLDENQI